MINTLLIALHVNSKNPYVNIFEKDEEKEKKI